MSTEQERQETNAFAEMLGMSPAYPTVDAAAISPDDARWILGYYSLEGGVRPGGFTSRLISAIACADPSNRARLRLGFPGLVAAFESQNPDLESIEFLQAIARGAGEPQR